MSTKSPKLGGVVSVSKNPKNVESPASYKHHPISWQISSIDDGGRWGISSLKDRYVFHDNDLSTTMDGIHEDLSYALLESDKQESKSCDEVLQNIINKSNGNISASNTPAILRNIISENIFRTKIYPKLKHFEDHCWEDIEKEQYGGKGKTKHHSIEVSKITREAKKRLADLNLDDIDELFSLRLEGKIRIWGIRQYSFLRILWIDLEHEICPPNNN